MARKHNRVTVRYRVTVYADVDLSTGEVVRVQDYVESIRLDCEDPNSEDAPLDVTEASYLDDPEGIHGPKITAPVAQRAVEIAESAEWPAWGQE